ncbi:hypothetical protein ACFFX1_33600 [Dactylosporangium sucinum]|uniref:hypothetical protein n=1 Tax=Dactylosporangium sucinum TaxID=1424081 RepID=UPI00167D14A6|nr:hypothetical protein [Dactylosporangium sucinum]
MIDFDPAAPFPELRQLVAAVRRSDWPAVAAFFAGVTDPDDHEYAVRLVADVPGSDAFLQAAAQREPGTLAQVLHAARLISVGWDIRSGARANRVSAEQFAGFHDHLRRAERILIDVTALEPGNSSAWVQRLKINRGLQLGQAEVRRRYDRLSRHVPHLYIGQAQVVQQFCQKWGGTDEKLHAFALECLRGAPGGSLAPISLLEAHLEIGMDWQNEANTVAYLRRPEVRTEIDEARARSVGHPDFRASGYRAITAHNNFALLYAKMGDLAAARPHFEFIGNHGGGFFWGYFGDEKIVFSALRSRALKA